MAAALKSSVVLALQRAAAAPASPRLSSAGRNAHANTCRRTMHHDYSGGSSDKGDGYFAAAAAFGTFLFVGLMDGEFYFWLGKENARQPRMSSRRRRIKMDMGNASMVQGLRVSFHLLEQITNRFSTDRILGTGAYGTVYMGEHIDGRKVAVKVLHEHLGVDDRMFEEECLNLACLQHKNIVRLVGYCHETTRECVQYDGRFVFAEMAKRALCFEYVHNGSLDRCLSGMIYETLPV
ncbi:hypothetical protein ACQ4PT_016329 [Festuca glaucescens]